MAKTNRNNVEQQTTQAIIVLENSPTLTNDELAAKGLGSTAIKAARRKLPHAKPTFVTEGERHALMGTYGSQAQAEAIAARNAPKAKPEPMALPAGAKPAGTAKPSKPAKGEKAAKPVAEAKPAKEPKGPSELYLEIVKFMRKGKPYTTREIVVGLGRTPGNAGGGPVVRELKKLVAEGKVKYESTENLEGFKTGYAWSKA